MNNISSNFSRILYTDKMKFYTQTHRERHRIVPDDSTEQILQFSALVMLEEEKDSYKKWQINPLVPDLHSGHNSEIREAVRKEQTHEFQQDPACEHFRALHPRLRPFWRHATLATYHDSRTLLQPWRAPRVYPTHHAPTAEHLTPSNIYSSALPRASEHPQ